MTRRIAVKLPDDLVREVDALVARGLFPSRAAVDRAYEEAYRRLPESEAELEEATHLAHEAIREEPWDRWW